MKQSTRALVFDSLGNYWSGVSCSNQREVKTYLERNYDRHFRVIYHPNIDMLHREANEQQVDWLCMVARWIAPCELFLDELDHFCDGSHMPEQLDGLVRYGRNIGITLRGAVRRPYVVMPRHFLTETTRFSIFRLVDPRDAGYISQFTGIETEEITALPKMTCLEWDEGERRKIRLTYRRESDIVLETA